jgi:hypothetical protein
MHRPSSSRYCNPVCNAALSALRDVETGAKRRNPANRLGHFIALEVDLACLATLQLIRAQKTRRAQPRFRGLRPACAFQRILLYLRKTLL